MYGQSISPDSRSMGSRTDFYAILPSPIVPLAQWISILPFHPPLHLDNGGDNSLVFLPACIGTVSRKSVLYGMEGGYILGIGDQEEEEEESPTSVGNCQFILRRRNDATRLHRDLYVYVRLLCGSNRCPTRISRNS